MNDRYLETLSAFFDGEPVDPDLLAESLAQPGAAAVLADFAAMRSHAAADAARPDEEWVKKTRSLLVARPRLAAIRRLILPVAVAASLVLVAGIVGFRLGSSAGNARVAATAGASPRLVGDVHLDAGVPIADAPAAGGPTVVASARPPGAPPPAILRLRFANWHDLSSAEEVQRH